MNAQTKTAAFFSYQAQPANTRDNIGLLAERAQAILELIMCHFDGGENSYIEPKIICSALEAVTKNLEDIQVLALDIPEGK